MGTLLYQFHGLDLGFHCMVWRLESFEGIFRGRMDAGHETRCVLIRRFFVHGYQGCIAFQVIARLIRGDELAMEG
jgi:hypothetical protein